MKHIVSSCLGNYMQLTDWSKGYTADNTKACHECQVVMVVLQPQSPNTQQSSAVCCMSQILSYPVSSAGRHFERTVDVIHSDPNNFSTVPEIYD